MDQVFENMSMADRERYISMAAQQLVSFALSIGINIRIERRLGTGGLKSVTYAVDAWEKADGLCGSYWSEPVQQPAGGVAPVRGPKPSPSRDGFAQDPGMREGCTVRVPGVGAL